MKPTKVRRSRKLGALEELAAQQGVGPANDLEAIVSLWPADDDPDELFHFILDERRARRERELFTADS